MTKRSKGRFKMKQSKKILLFLATLVVSTIVFSSVVAANYESHDNPSSDDIVAELALYLGVDEIIFIENTCPDSAQNPLPRARTAPFRWATRVLVLR